MFYFNRKLVTATGLLLLSSFSHAAFLSEPDPKWSIQLRDSGKESGRGLRQGNAIVSHRDGGKIIVTANDASLHIIQTTNSVKTLGVFEPEAIDGKSMECVSAPTVVYAVDQEGLFSSVEGEEDESPAPRMEDFVLYAVIDGDTTSRLVAVDMEGALKWTFEFDGKIEGSPAVGKSGIYVTTNKKSALGIVSKLQLSPIDGTAVLAATAGVYNVELGPPVLQQAVENKNNNNKNNGPNDDTIVVAESGTSQTQGGLYLFPSDLASSPEIEIEDELSIQVETSGRFDYELTKISSWSYGATSPPLVYGDSIFVGAAGGTIGGFTGDRKNDLSGITSGRETAITPRWDFQMSLNPFDPSRRKLYCGIGRNHKQCCRYFRLTFSISKFIAVQTQPTVNLDGSILCAAGVDNDIYCVSVEEGRQIWRAEEASEFLAKPIILRGERRTAVFAIETENGRVHQYDLFSGRRLWNYSCSDASNNLCQDPVEADFTIMPGGNTLFYGDIYGRINCLGVASFETESPTIAPTGEPTMSPTASPTITRTPTQMPQEAVVAQTDDTSERDDVIVLGGDDDGDASGSQTSASQDSWFTNNRRTVYIAGAVAALCAIIIPFLLCAMIRRKKKKLLTNKNLVVEMVDDSSSNEDDLEAQAQQFFDQIETTNTYDPNNGGGIEVGFINNPQTANDSGDDNSELAVLQAFADQLSEHNTDDSRSLDDVPPPPPSAPVLEESSVTKSTTSERSFAKKGGKLKTMGWRKKNKKADTAPLAAPKPLPEPEKEYEEEEQPSAPVEVNEVEESAATNEEESDDDSSTDEYVKELQKEAEARATAEADEEVAEDEKSVTEEANNETQSVNKLPETPASPSVSDVISGAMKFIAPEDASPAIQQSMSGTSDDDSLYTSYTGYSGLFGGKTPKKETNDMSLYNKYVYDQEVRRRDRDEIVNEKKSSLSPPALDDEHPDDEMTGHRRPTSARASKFLSNNSPEKESKPTSIGDMYDQLAAIGQQRREARVPSFKRRNKRHEQEAAKKQQGDTWGSFLNELAEAEKDFYSPSSSKSKKLLEKSKTENAAEPSQL